MKKYNRLRLFRTSDRATTSLCTGTLWKTVGFVNFEHLTVKQQVCALTHFEKTVDFVNFGHLTVQQQVCVLAHFEKTIDFVNFEHLTV